MIFSHHGYFYTRHPGPPTLLASFSNSYFVVEDRNRVTPNFSICWEQAARGKLWGFPEEASQSAPSKNRSCSKGKEVRGEIYLSFDFSPGAIVTKLGLHLKVGLHELKWRRAKFACGLDRFSPYIQFCIEWNTNTTTPLTLAPLNHLLPPGRIE